MRFSIRDIIWLTAVVALLVGWWIERNKLMGIAASAQKLARETEAERAVWELRSQHEAVAHKETLRLIDEYGLVRVGYKGKVTLEPKRDRDLREGFSD